MTIDELKFLFIIMLATVGAQAQNGFTLDGHLKDRNGDPVPFANVSLSDSSNRIITGVASNINGDFEITDIKQGAYNINIQFVGYETWGRPNVLVNQDIHLGNLTLNESSQVLNEIVIRGEAMKKPFEVSAQGITINPSQNLANIGGSALDILRNTPSIGVDGEGTITLRGSSSTNILINGRNSSLAANLDQIPASAIKSIKVINNPGAKYDANAKGGIINIELKKGEGLGTHGNIDATYGTSDRYNGSFKLSHQTKNYQIYGGYDLRQSINNGVFEGYRETFNEGNQYLSQGGAINRKSLNQNFRWGADYFFGRNQLTYEGVFRKGKDRDREVRISDFQEDGNAERTNRYNFETEDGHALDNALIYERSFRTENRSFKVQLSHSSRSNTEVQNIKSYRQSLQGDNSTQQRGSNGEERSISVIQMDYVHPLANENRIETGFKTVLRNFDNDYTFEAFEGRWINDPSISNRFLYKEQVHAFYATYSQKLGRVNFAVGNRLEQSIINTTQYAFNERNKLSYLKLFPSASVQYKINERQDIRFTYSRRIDRPSAWQLNPFPDIADSLNIRTGNPKLQPEYIQSLELGQHISLRKFDLTTTLFHRHTSGIVDYIVTIDENGTSHGRPENLASGSDTGLEIIASSNITPWWAINASYAIFRRSVDGSNVNQNFTNRNIAWNTKMVSDFALPWDLKLQLNFNYASEEVEAQGKDFARYGLDASLAKSFLDNKIRASIGARDVFDTRKYGGTSYGDGFFQKRSYKPQSRLIFLSVGIKLH